MAVICVFCTLRLSSSESLVYLGGLSSKLSTKLLCVFIMYPIRHLFLLPHLSFPLFLHMAPCCLFHASPFYGMLWCRCSFEIGEPRTRIGALE